MSNLAELLQSLVGKNSEVIGVGGQVLTLAGGFLGAAADVGGALALIFGASGSDIEADLQEIRDSLYHILETVNEINWRERWDDINSRLSTVDQTMKEPYSVVSTLQLDLAAEPPLDEAARSDRVQKCFAALVLGKDEYWNLPNTDLDYYRDPWNSEMHPSYYLNHAHPDPIPLDSVFCDLYVLPQYVMAIAIYVLVLRAFFPDYDVRSDPVIRQALHGAADRLRSVHDTSMSGILHMMVPCNVPPVGDVLTCDDWVPVYVATSWDLGGGPQNYYDDAVQFFQPFGCVHTFSGYSNFGKFPPYPDGRVLQTEDPAIGFLFARKIGLATRHRWKATYTGIGLASVWAVMNRLYEITGDATVAGDRGWEGWTGREIRSIVTYPITHAQVPPHGETAWILNDGTFKAGEPFSFRGVLEGLYQLSGLIGPGAPAVPEFSLRAGMEAAILREPIQDLMQWWGAW